MDTTHDKASRMEAFLAGLILPGLPGLHPCYAAYFRCFNEGRFYEAHDILEHLWLATTGPDNAFYKGLIQLAGAFVHLEKQAARPWHPKDGRRLQPASRLFALAAKNLAPFAPEYHGMKIAPLTGLCADHIAIIQSSTFTINPLLTARPQLAWPVAASCARSPAPDCFPESPILG